jgi:hypothetical protein
MRRTFLTLAVPVLAALVGCAHPMIIKPDIAALSAVAVPESARIQKSVGLYIPEADKAKLVTTKGGGGDKVRYAPYADLETGIYKVLSDVFQRVTLLKSPTDAGSQGAPTYVVQPEITTTSSSTGILTWMATDFSVSVNLRFNAPGGGNVTSASATGTGKAVFDELKGNFSLAGVRASQDALDKLRTALLASPELRK